jgi:hypothetical protein
MENHIKKIKSVIKINKNISNNFLRFIKIKDLRKNPDETVVILKEPVEFEIDFSKYSIDSVPYWKSFKTLSEHKTFYSVIPNASIVSKGIVINSNNEVILESTIFQLEYLNELYSNHLVVLRNGLPNSKHPKVFPVLNRLDNNYYHWTMESLMRVLLVYKKPEFKDYQILIKEGGSRFMFDSLKFLFQLSNKQIITKSLLKVIITDSTLVVSFPHIRNQQTQMTNVYYPSVICEFNRLAQKRITESDDGIQSIPKNILVSRRYAIERRIVNEDEFLKKLEAHNFHLVFLEHLTFKEQVSLFYGAEKIIAVHGAGITNIIYGNKPLLIELFPKERNIRDAFYFAQITAALKFKHEVIEYTSSNKEQDVEIDQNILEEILSKLG